ncbi:hypothetical protein GCM10022406_19940 [Hymenobacter algoricola]|uniref:Uncharacterized protein n=1 Tax=Hymenobacter algoricola TaxID=486267 RepID=A0ABP7N2X3_9BACT
MVGKENQSGMLYKFTAWPANKLPARFGVVRAELAGKGSDAEPSAANVRKSGRVGLPRRR